jgi:hypothetical protein
LQRFFNAAGVRAFKVRQRAFAVNFGLGLKAAGGEKKAQNPYAGCGECCGSAHFVP